MMFILSVAQTGAPNKCKALFWEIAAGCREAEVSVRWVALRNQQDWVCADLGPAPRPFSWKDEGVCFSFVRCSVVGNLPVIVSSTVLVS